jgi:hypothetical protein
MLQFKASLETELAQLHASAQVHLLSHKDGLDCAGRHFFCHHCSVFAAFLDIQPATFDKANRNIGPDLETGS